VWRIIWRAAGKGEEELDTLYEPPPQGWRIPLEEGGALVLGRHRDRRAIVLKTVLVSDDVEAA
jgi:hypothetical protein